MNKICTSIKQSKKLIKLGLDVNTADMMWDDWNLIDEGWKLSVGYHPEIEKDYGRKCYPAWSLTALIDLMPKIGFEKPVIDLSPNLGSEEVAIFYHEDGPYIVRDNLVDVAFEMVCWLKENGKI